MTNGNDLAHPETISTIEGGSRSIGGLTKREYFAAMCLQGILANPIFLEKHDNVDLHKLAVKNAYYLIDELNKQQ